MKLFNKKLSLLILAIFITSIITLSAKINFNSNPQPNKTEGEPLVDIQSSASPLSKEHQILPVSILVYTEYADIDEEYTNTMQAIRNTYGTDFYHENLTDYTELDAKLPGHDILLIPEQEDGGNSENQIVGNAWATTLTNFINDGGIVIMLDNNQPTFHIGNESGLFKFYGATYLSVPTTVNLVNNNDALARGVSTSWTSTPSLSVCSIDTTEITSVVDDGTDPIVIHKIMGRGHLVVIGCDFTNIEGNFSTILGNAIRLHRHVIFDGSHTQLDDIFGDFSDYTDDLVSEGFAVSNMSSFNPAYINSGDVFIVTRGNTVYSSAEVDVIENFVKNGGGLFVATDSQTHGDEIDPLINRFGFIREDTYRLEDNDDLLGAFNQSIEYDNIVNHSLTLGVSTIELYFHTGFTTVPLSADVIIATDTDGTSYWSNASPADGIPVVATVVTAGNGRIAAFSDGTFMWDNENVDGDGTSNYEDGENEVLLVNSIRWLSAAGIQEKIVLFDESKVPAFDLSNEYDTFGHYLTMNGYTLKWMSTFHPNLVNDANIVFICGGGLSHSVSEINTILSFVKAGGGLYLVGQEGLYGQNLNSIAVKYGMTLNTTSSFLRDSDDEMAGAAYIKYGEANFASHSITQGIKRIEVFMGVGLTSNSTGTPLINTDTDDTCYWASGGNPLANGISILQAMDYGVGRVILCTDFILMADGFDQDSDGDDMFFDSDNKRLMVNSFQWLSEAGIPSAGGGGGGGGDDDKKAAPIPWLLLAGIIGGIVVLIAITVIIMKLRSKRT